jgi:hypothetical protein
MVDGIGGAWARAVAFFRNCPKVEISMTVRKAIGKYAVFASCASAKAYVESGARRGLL